MEAYEAALSDGTTMVLSPDSEFFRFFNELPGVKKPGQTKSGAKGK